MCLATNFTDSDRPRDTCTKILAHLLFTLPPLPLIHFPLSTWVSRIPAHLLLPTSIYSPFRWPIHIFTQLPIHSFPHAPTCPSSHSALSMFAFPFTYSLSCLFILVNSVVCPSTPPFTIRSVTRSLVRLATRLAHSLTSLPTPMPARLLTQLPPRI